MVKELINNGNIKQAISSLRVAAAKYPHENFTERINSCKENYTYICDYMMKGFKDPQREKLFEELCQRLSDLDYDIYVRDNIENSSYRYTLLSYLDTYDRSDDFIRQVNSKFTDSENDYNFLNFAFSMLMFSYHWNNKQQQEWSIFLSSPDTNPLVAATLVTGITISALQRFSRQKTLCLASVYCNSNNEMVRQRAYVGALLSLCRSRDDDMSTRKQVLDLLTDPKEQYLEGIFELYMQLVACTNVERDAKEISDEIIPDIMRNQPFKMTRDGIVETKQLTDDYDPDAENKSIDAVENGVKRMLDMQRRGTDIFYSTFIQLRRFPFFEKPVNWLTPFNINHPELANINDKLKQSNFIKQLATGSNLCESDKFSFLLSMNEMVRQIPNNMLDMIENGSVGPLGISISKDDEESPAAIRLHYLQDINRFFRRSKIAEKIYNPFWELERGQLFTVTATHISDKEKKDACNYFISRDSEDSVRGTIARILRSFSDKESLAYNFCMAKSKVITKDYTVAIQLYQKCLNKNPKHIGSIQGLARAYYSNGDFDKAAFYYDALHTLFPERTSYLLNYCMAMTRDGKAAEIMNELYRLDYETPNDITILNTMAWAQLYANEPEKALTTITKITALRHYHENFSVVLIVVYAYLANNKPQDAVDLLNMYIATLSDFEQKEFPTRLLKEMKDDAPLLLMHNIGVAERAIIISQITREE